MTRMSLLACMFICMVTPAQALYICQPSFTRQPPDITGKNYRDARAALLEDHWTPVVKSSGRLPELESCDERAAVACKFIFQDAAHGYALVVEAEGNAHMVNMDDLKVTGHHFRCSP